MNGLIVATGSGGSYTGHFGLFEGQILLGGASSLDVKGVTTGAMATYTPGLTRPTIIHDGTLNSGAVVVSGVDHGKDPGRGHHREQPGGESRFLRPVQRRSAAEQFR